eukprot:TRINITY_DN9134_c0_g1_i1.p1 TRINITY_DN9134_c0_g1~~TRINITY_DN9134_c0_g1_i1.p1  ORF type:complete len:219 (-),score=37.03 TRINITY_DN9134_c0_g1_i1:24-680(-)
MSLIPLSQKEGQDILAEVQGNSNAATQYDKIAPFFAKQQNCTFCGIQTTCIILNTLNSYPERHVDNVKKIVYKESVMFELEKTKSVLCYKSVSLKGMTLDELGKLLKSHHTSVKVYHTSDLAKGKRQFKELAINQLYASKQNKKAIAINYLMSKLGQNYGGHISPLVAYHGPTDRFLLMDVWPHTPEAWVATDDLWAAMDTIDEDSKMKRGFVLIEKK